VHTECLSMYYFPNQHSVLRSVDHAFDAYHAQQQGVLSALQERRVSFELLVNIFDMYGVSRAAGPDDW
jgi:hypothetical protein